MTDIYAVVGKNLQVWRKHCGLTQAEVAEKAGISIAFLSFLETGRKKGSLETYHKLAVSMGISLSLLVSEKGGKARMKAGPLDAFNLAERQAVYKLARILHRKGGK